MGTYTQSIGSLGGTITGDVAELVVPASTLSGPVSITLETSVVSGVKHCTVSVASGTLEDLGASTLSIEKPDNYSSTETYVMAYEEDEEWVDDGGDEDGGGGRIEWANFQVVGVGIVGANFQVRNQGI